MITVMSVDSCPFLVEGLNAVFSDTREITLSGHASSGAEIMALLKQKLPDILTLGLSLPDRFGIDMIKDLQTLYATLPVLVLSKQSVRDFSVRSLRAGAKGFLHKADLPNELVTAVRRIVTDGKCYIPSAVADQLALTLHKRGSDQLPHQQLSDREFEVFCLIGEGKNISEIGNLLSLSPHTVHTYRSRIKEKMDLSSNVDITRYALRHGLVQ